MPFAVFEAWSRHAVNLSGLCVEPVSVSVGSSMLLWHSLHTVFVLRMYTRWPALLHVVAANSIMFPAVGSRIRFLHLKHLVGIIF